MRNYLAFAKGRHRFVISCFFFEYCRNTTPWLWFFLYLKVVFNYLLILLLALAVHTRLQGQDSLWVGTSTSIRALAVIDEQLWWFGGSKGWLGRTSNAGQSWQNSQPLGDQVDFRCLHAFSAEEAVAAVSGQPAVILHTSNGGKSWEEVYRAADTTTFFDAISFWNSREGLLFGDPDRNGRLVLLRTSDGGRSWESLPDAQRPIFAPGEAAFAASGTAMTVVGDSTVVVVSGGSMSRLWYSRNRGSSWQHIRTDIPNPALGGPHLLFPDTLSPQRAYLLRGEPSRGAFSVALTADSQWAIVGGDYRIDSLRLGHVVTNQYGQWWRPRTPTLGYRECVLPLDTFLWVATGPSGTDISWNGGLDWFALNSIGGMHVAKALGKKGILLAGNRGKLWRYSTLPAKPVKDWQPQTKLGKEVYAGQMQNFQKKLFRELKRHRRGSKDQHGYTNFARAYNHLVHYLQKQEGVSRVWVDSCGARLLLYPAFGRISFEVETHTGSQTYVLGFREGKVYRCGWLRHRLGLATTRDRLTQPTLVASPDAARWAHRLCEWER